MAREHGANVLYLDGQNNPGFSGGPIVFRDLKNPAVIYKLTGVVSAFRADPVPVLKPEAIAPQQVTPEDLQKSRLR